MEMPSDMSMDSGVHQVLNHLAGDEAHRRDSSAINITDSSSQTQSTQERSTHHAAGAHIAYYFLHDLCVLSTPIFVR